MTNGQEVEVKIRLANPAGILDRFRSSGLAESVPRQFEANTLYDTSAYDLRKQEMLLRLRQIGEKGVITWKGRGNPGVYKSRAELETTVGSVETLAQILNQLGFRPFFRYEKYRTEFVAKPRQGVVTLDETPIGTFLELEGPGDWIDEIAKQLGFSRADYIVDSYGRLYLAECERRGVQPT
ncbi:MAG: class IV adenylate cyclase, partial [Acidobacteriaceae bacterium]|nr:class IV adenylate cyclase [Acidobacteriaceae bacterium]